MPAPPLLHTCGAPLAVDSTQATCTECGASVPVDELGTVVLSAVERSWPGIPAIVDRDVSRARTAEEIIEAMLGGSEPWPEHLASRLLHPAGGVAAALVDVVEGSTALDLGTGWSTLPTALASLGATVVSADWVPTRLRFAQLMLEHPPAQAAVVDPTLGLPWADASFDLVFVDLAAAPTGHDHLLGEIRRVLAPSGHAVVRVTGPLHHGRKAVLRHPRRFGRAPWRHPAFAAAGLSAVRAYVPRPRFEGWTHIVTADDLASAVRSDARGRKGRLIALLARAGLAHLVVRDALVVAARPPVDRPASSAPVDVAAGESAVTLSLTDARLAVRGATEFAKFPLSTSQQAAIVAEVDKTRLAADTGFAAYVVGGARVEHHHDVPYSVFPLVEHAPVARDTVEDVLLGAVRSVAATPARLDATTLWQRLLRPRGVDDAAEVGATAIRRAVLDKLASAVVPTGATHGDLHESNVMVTPDGTPYLVDWNRFELNNPLFLDPLYASVRLHEARRGVGLAKALEAFADGEVEGPLAEYATELLGDLTVEQALCVMLLDRIASYSLPRRRHKPWTLPPFERAAERLSGRLDRWAQ